MSNEEDEREVFDDGDFPIGLFVFLMAATIAGVLIVSVLW